MDELALRNAFPVLTGTAYLNAGTCGPLPQVAADAGRAALERDLAEGRSTGYYLRLADVSERLRAAYARLLGAAAADVALTAGSSDGIARVVAGLGLGAGDEIVTADDEHPGLYGPLIDARERRGVTITTAPLDDLAAAIGPRTRLVACSHVSWRAGRHAPLDALRAACGDGVPLLLDAAQSAGAVPANVAELGATFYAGSGQKWLCGAVGTGMLWVSPAWSGRLATPGLHYGALDGQVRGLDASAAETARRFDAPSLNALSAAVSLAAFELLDGFGFERIHRRSAALARALAEQLTARGRAVAPRHDGPLVAWDAGSDAAATAAVARATGSGVVIRDLPGTGRLRASVGAWSDEDDIDRLLAVLDG